MQTKLERYVGNSESNSRREGQILAMRLLTDLYAVSKGELFSLSSLYRPAIYQDWQLPLSGHKYLQMTKV